MKLASKSIKNEKCPECHLDVLNYNYPYNGSFYHWRCYYRRVEMDKSNK